MSWLPVGEDQDKVSHVYGYLCDLVQENHSVVVRPNHANLPRVLAIIAEARSKDVLEIDSNFYSRMLSTIVECCQLLSIVYGRIYYGRLYSRAVNRRLLKLCILSQPLQPLSFLMFFLVYLLYRYSYIFNRFNFQASTPKPDYHGSGSDVFTTDSCSESSAAVTLHCISASKAAIVSFFSFF